jgi:hypothetical protein
VGPGDEDEQPKSFLDEVFEHRQVRPEPADEPDEVEAVEDVQDTLALGAAAPIADAPEDPVHPGAVPEPGVAGGSGVVPEDLGVPVEAAPEPERPVRRLDPLESALIDESMKKSGLIWLDLGSGPIAQAAWYVWVDGAAYVLTGDAEQPDPGLATAGSVGVIARSKETRSLLVEWTGSAARVPSTDDRWDEIASALAKARLNLAEPATAPQRWAADPDISIFRITPTGPLLEAPGGYSGSSRRAAPAPTPATTAGAPPKVVHRRKTARRPLS